MSPNLEKTDVGPVKNYILPEENSSSNIEYCNDEENKYKILKGVPLCEKRQYRYSKINIITFTHFYLGGLYGLYRLIYYAQFYTVLYCAFLSVSGALGISVGVHRYWSHRSFKARAPLRLLLLLMFSLCGQNSVAYWVRDHRVHHIYSDTDGDPHNARRGFFFSQVGWLLVEKHPAVKRGGKPISMKDLYDDPIIAFHQRHSVAWILIFTYILPTIVPLLWEESLTNAWYVASMFRFLFIFNATSLINSFAHMYGNRPYDSNIAPTDHWLIQILAFGDGFHNFHHTFPWDYRGGESGAWNLNISTRFIEFFAWIGWAYDLKTASDEQIDSRARKTGDGTRKACRYNSN